MQKHLQLDTGASKAASLQRNSLHFGVWCWCLHCLFQVTVQLLRLGCSQHCCAEVQALCRRECFPLHAFPQCWLLCNCRLMKYFYFYEEKPLPFAVIFDQLFKMQFQHQFVSHQGLTSNLFLTILLLILNLHCLWTSEVTTCALCSFLFSSSECICKN